MNVLAGNYNDKSKQMQTDLIKKAAMGKMSKSVAKNPNERNLKLSQDGSQKSDRNFPAEEKEPMFEAERKKRVISNICAYLSLFSCLKCIIRKRLVRCKHRVS